jgi:hypothetical protein
MNHQCRAAIVSYEAFLRSMPAPRQEAATKDQIDLCRAELVSEATASGKPPAPPSPAAPPPAAAPPPSAVAIAAAPAPSAPPPAPGVVANVAETASPPAERAPTPVYRRWWFWALIGGGVGAGVAIAAAAGAFTHTMEPSCGPPLNCSSPMTTQP